jgi:acyl-coenzyme A thioesterase PaaI-like protein
VEVTYDGHCFGCGDKNPDGLQMRFTEAGQESVCEFTVPARYQSWNGMVHGGLVALMLDEALGWAAWHSGHPGVTGKLEVRLRLPLEVGERVKVTGRVDGIRRSLVYTSASITRLRDGATVAEATGTLMAAAATIV